MTIPPPSPLRLDPGRTGNRLLDLLPEPDLARLLAAAERATARPDDLVAQTGEPARFADFPLTSVLSAVIPLHDGSAIEVTTIGREGMAGFDFLTDRPMSVHRVVCQIPGESVRVAARDFRELLTDGGPLRRVLERYVLSIVHQAGQNAACNLRHTVEERMCRWLLMTHDRVGRDDFGLTQDYLAVMLGVRRQSVSLAASILQEAGFIRYSRGHITVVNRAGLESACCECYAAIKETYSRVMGTDHPTAGQPI